MDNQQGYQMIVQCFIDAVREAGADIDYISDGEDRYKVAGEAGWSDEKIIEHVRATDHSFVGVGHPGQDKKMGFQFVFGNDPEETIADHSENGMEDAIWRRTNSLFEERSGKKPAAAASALPPMMSEDEFGVLLQRVAATGTSDPAMARALALIANGSPDDRDDGVEYLRAMIGTNAWGETRFEAAGSASIATSETSMPDAPGTGDKVDLTLNLFDAEGRQTGSRPVSMTRNQVQDVVDHAAQLVVVRRDMSADKSGIDAFDQVWSEFEDAVVMADLVEQDDQPLRPLNLC